MTMRTLHLLSIAVLVSATACFTGPSVGRFRPAQTGHGIEGELRLRDRRVDGELLEIRDSAYVLVSSDSVMIVPFTAVRGAHFDALGSVGGGRPRIDNFALLQLSSRFPRGISDATMAQLLAVAGQSSMSYVR
jgi:hypothetical protein